MHLKDNKCKITKINTLQHINTILQPLYGSTCVSQHLQLRTGGFCCCKPTCLADVVCLLTTLCWITTPINTCVYVLLYEDKCKTTSALGLGRKCWHGLQCYRSHVQSKDLSEALAELVSCCVAMINRSSTCICVKTHPLCTTSLQFSLVSKVEWCTRSNNCIITI